MADKKYSDQVYQKVFIAPMSSIKPIVIVT